MQREKHEELAVFMYLMVLMAVVIVNMMGSISLFDLTYLFVVICCVFRFFLIIKSKKE